MVLEKKADTYNLCCNMLLNYDLLPLYCIPVAHTGHKSDTGNKTHYRSYHVV